MMTRSQAYEFAADRFYIDEMGDEEFTQLMWELMMTPHKPWCRTRLREAMPVYGGDCTCDETGTPPGPTPPRPEKP